MAGYGIIIDFIQGKNKIFDRLTIYFDIVIKYAFETNRN